MALDNETFYDFVIEYKELQEAAHFKLEWVSVNVPREVVPPTAIYYPERVTGRVYQLTTTQGPSIASTCTAHNITNSTVGKRSYFSIQSRDFDGKPYNNTGDQFLVTFTGPAEGGPTGVVNSGTFSSDAEHQYFGLYVVQYIPEEAGTYTLKITLGGDRIKGSDWTVYVSPGEIAPHHSNHSLVAPINMVAGVTNFFDLTMKDVYRNLIMSHRENTTVEITASYVNHNSWLSVIGVSDFADWPSIYGLNVSGVAFYDNSTWPVTYKNQITVFRAGLFSLDVKVNRVHTIGSPITQQVFVAPAELYAPTCIVSGLPLNMVAGTEYTFLIQTRDFYSNNRKGLLAASIQSWDANITVNGSDSSVCNGTIIDSPTAGHEGVFKVAFTPTVAGNNFKIILKLNGLDVDQTAAYRTQLLVVTPKATTSAPHSNYTILASTD